MKKNEKILSQRLCNKSFNYYHVVVAWLMINKSIYIWHTLRCVLLGGIDDLSEMKKDGVLEAYEKTFREIKDISLSTLKILNVFHPPAHHKGIFFTLIIIKDFFFFVLILTSSHIKHPEFFFISICICLYCIMISFYVRYSLILMRFIEFYIFSSHE